MNLKVTCLLCIAFVLPQSFFVMGSQAAKEASLTNSSQGASAVATPATTTGVVFAGLTESGVTRNTFLCGATSVTGSAASGTNFEASNCAITAVKAAAGFDISEGATLQFFNNFTYWLQQKSEQEQSYQINDSLTGSALGEKMNSEGWGSMGACCVIVSTNQIVKETVYQSVVANSGEVKVVVQLWYNGDNLIQLWSQDSVSLKPGQSFTVAISNSPDARLKSTFVAGTGLAQYLAAINNDMQPDNRNEDSYSAATNSPRMVRIVAA